MLKKFFVFGIISPVLYLIHVILGGILWSGYSHIAQPISDLTATGAPNREMLGIFTNMYSIFGLIFALSAFIYLKKLRIKTINISMILFIAEFLITFLYSFFPEDLLGTAMTFRGFMHFVVTGLIVPVVILAPLFAGFGFRKLNDFKKFSIYSIATSIIIFVSGGISVAFAVNKTPFFGVAERINIGSLQLWVFIFALVLLLNDIEQPKIMNTGKNKVETV